MQTVSRTHQISDRKGLSPILEQPEHETAHLFWCHPTLEHACNDALPQFHQCNKESYITTYRQFCAYDDILKHAVCLNYVMHIKGLLISMCLSQWQYQSENEVEEMKQQFTIKKKNHNLVVNLFVSKIRQLNGLHIIYLSSKSIKNDANCRTSQSIRALRCPVYNEVNWRYIPYVLFSEWLRHIYYNFTAAN